MIRSALILCALLLLGACQRPYRAPGGETGELEVRGEARWVAVPPNPVVEARVAYRGTLTLGAEGIPRSFELTLDLGSLACADPGWGQRLKSPELFGDAGMLELRSGPVTRIGERSFRARAEWSFGGVERTVELDGVVEEGSTGRVWRLLPALDARDFHAHEASADSEFEPRFLVELVLEASTEADF